MSDEKKIPWLHDRKSDMIERMNQGESFPEYQSTLSEAEEDEDLAFHYLIRDLILDCKKLREERGLTQAELADKMGTKQSAVSRFENYFVPSLKFVFKYTRALGACLTITPHSLEIQKETQDVIIHHRPAASVSSFSRTRKHSRISSTRHGGPGSVSTRSNDRTRIKKNAKKAKHHME